MVSSAGQVPVTLETERLRLDPLTAADLQELHRLFIHPHMRRYLWDDTIIELMDAEMVIARSNEAFSSGGFGLWRMAVKPDSAMMGFCGLLPFDTEEVEILYGVAEPFCGAGLAVEASRSVLAHGFVRCRLTRIWARTDPPNTASQRVALKLGMTPGDPGEVHGRPLLTY